MLGGYTPIQVSGYSPPKPCVAFAHFGFDDELMALIRKSEFTQPTPIQSQAIPVALSGRDIIGIAKTGSGKTAAFLWPLLVHAIDQPELEEEDGPIGLICAPTRELCQQVSTNTPLKKTCTHYHSNSLTQSLLVFHLTSLSVALFYPFNAFCNI